MKKKILLTLIITLMACMLMFTLSACGDKTPQITGITVSGQAEVYIDEFDYADYTITATYDNGTTENVTLQAEHLSAEDNAKISTVGTHTLTITYSGKTATLSLTVKNHDFYGVTFEDKTVTYNGLPQTIEVLGLPSGANITYSPNNTYTEVGEYPVTATITNQYYNELKLTATLKITDIIRKITFVQAGVEDIVKEVVDGGTLSEKEIPTPQEINGYEVTWNRTDFTNITSNVTVEIEKTLKTYTITYVLNGGTNYINNPKEFTIESPTLTLYTPSKEIGATFAGWYTNSAFTDESKITEIKHGSYGNKTIYAKWLDYRIENADGFTIDYKQQPALVSMTVPYTTENIDLNSRFTVSKGCTWKLFSDFTGNYEFPLKAMTLNVGENKAYIIVFHPDGEHFTRYLLNIYRLDMKEYAFMNGLSVWKDGEIQERSELSAPTTNPEKTGYTFGGWAVDGNKVEFPYTVTEDVIFTAIFIPIEYDIVYNLNNGELNTNKTKYTIEQYFTFDTPTRDYYTFSGWFNNANFDGNAITGVSIGTYGKINLFAKWTPVDYVIDYEENGGTNDKNNPTEYNVETATITLKNPTKDGFTFNGWYTESTFNTKVTQIVKGSHGNIKLYAKWTENVNGLNFDGNGNTSGSMTAIALKTGETKAIPLNTFVKTGYTFKGWATSANGSVVYNDGANYTMGTNSQYTLYAVWEANLNTLTFNGNGANGGSTSSMQIRTDANKALNENGFTRTKYLFAGWAETANGAVKYTDGATYTMGTNASYTLYAVWTLNENEITFNGNGNTSGSMPNQTVYNNGNKVLNDNAFVKTGYHFIGWAESADGEVKYTDGATVTFVQKENYTLYAKWEANTNTKYKVEYYLENLENDEYSLYTTDNLEGVSDSNVEAQIKIFEHFAPEKEEVKGIVAPDDSLVLKVYYQRNEYTVKFDKNNGTLQSGVEIQTIKYGGTIIAPNYQRVGYTFIGFDKSFNDVVSDITVAAMWSANSYEIAFDSNGWLGEINNKTVVYDNYINLEVPDRNGYVFIGWYYDEEKIENGLWKIPHDVILVAKWEAIYLISNSTLLGLTEYGKTNFDKLIIPSVIDGININSLANDAFKNNINLKEVIIPKEIITIGQNVFEGCIALETLHLPFIGTTIDDSTNNYLGFLFGATQYIENETFVPSSLKKVVLLLETKLSWGAFYKCSSLEEVVVPESCLLIENYAFYGCSSLESITLPFVGSGSKTDYFYDEAHFGYIFGAGADHDNDDYVPQSLTTVVITGGDEIAYGAFYRCNNIVNLTLPFVGNTAVSDADRYKNLFGYIFKGGYESQGGVYQYSPDLGWNYDYYFIPLSLKSITILGGEVYDGAFSNCSMLTEINFGKDVNFVIGDAGQYFGGCSSLEEINIDKNNPNFKVENHTLYSSNYKRLIFSCAKEETVFSIPTGVEEITRGAFRYCKSLTTILLPNSVTNIGSSAFEDCSSLTSVTIGNGVTSIGNYAFYNCSSLISVDYTGTIDQWVQIKFDNYYSNPLYYAKKLYINGELVTQANITTSTKINDYAFYNCSSLTSIEIPDTVTSIGDDAFYGCQNGIFTIEGNLKYLGSSTNKYYALIGAAYKNSSSYTINEITKIISDYAFYDCTSLKSVEIPNGVTSIGYRAFYSCGSLTSIEIPDSVTSIGAEAFSWCTSLTSIEIPNSVTSIGAAAFRNCTALEEINFNATNCADLSSDNYVFAYAGQEGEGIKVTFGDNVKHIPAYLFYPYYKDSYAPKITSITLGDSVTSIGDYAFAHCESLTSIKILDNVTSIGFGAFYYCDSLTNIIIGNGVESIVSHAFYGCSSLTSITIPNNVISIGDYAFSGCNSLTNIIIGNGVESIGSHAFSNCGSLTSITIPNNVISIGDYAFSGCNSLKSVCYTGTEEEWANISIGSNDTLLTNATRFYNYGGQNHTYKFIVNGGQEVADITSNLAITLPQTTREGFVFVGWYDNAEFTGTAYFTTYYSSINTTLYAKWLSEEYFDGSSFERAITLTSGSATANIDIKGEKIYYKFIPTESKSYIIKSSGGLDTYGYLYDSNGSQLTSHDGSTDFTITRSLTAGRTYYIVVKMYSSSATGTFTVSIT